MSTFQQKIYLASKSPRRRELLRQVGIDFELILLREALPRGPDVSEIVIPGELPEDYVARVTQEKVQTAWKVLGMRKLPLRPILSADTTVVIDNEILGKPENRQHALDMLQRLSGRSHKVLTSIALRHEAGCLQSTQTSLVSFTEMTPTQMQAYADTQEPYDKAGGYGIQGLAARYISHIDGSYSGIMGLPLFETCNLLRQAGLALP